MEEYPIRNTSKEYTEEYISLREATKYCPYSGGYLKLRARQGKLKAVKFGRNWVTKKEWVEEYLNKNQNSNLKNQKVAEVGPPQLRPAMALALVFVLLLAGIVFGKPGSEFLTRFAKFDFLKENPVKNLLPGKESLKNGLSDIEDFAGRVGERTDLVAAEIFNSTKNFVSLGVEGGKIVFTDTFANVDEILVGFGQSFASAFSDLKLVKKDFQLMAADVSGSPIEISKGFFSWLGERLISIPKKIVEGIKEIPQMVAQPFKKEKPPEIVSPLPKEKIPEEIVYTEFYRSAKKEIEELRAEIKKLKEEGLPVKEIIKEVSKITKIEPIKEITKEKITERIPSEELAQIKTQLSQFTLWGTDIENLKETTRRIQNQIPSVSLGVQYTMPQPVYLDGSATLSSLSVSGSGTINTLTVNAASYFKGLSTFGTGTLTIDSVGNLTTTGTLTVATSTLSNLTTTGNLVVGGDLTVSGAQTYSGAADFTASSTVAALTLNQTGSGNLVDFQVATSSKFVINNSGEITTGIWKATPIGTQWGGTGQDWSAVATGSIPYFSGLGAMTTLAPGTSGYFLQTLGPNATPTWAQVVQVWSDSGTALYPTNLSRNVGIGTSTPSYTLEVVGTVGITTSTNQTALTVTQSGSGNIVDLKDATGSVFTIANNGDITTGTWKATPIGAAYGGTGTSTASWTGAPYITTGVWGTTTVQTGTEKYGPTVIVAAQNSTNTSRAHYQCDGTADNVEIQQAIDALPAGIGGTVLLLEGTYNTTSTINIVASSTSLIGSGKSTILRKAGDMFAMITVGDGGTTAVSGVTIDNLSIDGQKASYIDLTNSGIYFNKKVSKSRILNNWIYNTGGRAIYLLGASGSENTQNLIQGNDIRDIDWDGMQLSYSDNNSVIGNTVQTNYTRGGFYDFFSQGNLYLGNTSLSNRYGFWSDALTADESGVVFTGNSARANSYYGFYLIDTDGCVVSNNYIEGNSRHGIYLSSSGNCNIVGNRVYNSGGSEAYDGIRLETDSDGTIVSSNIITDTAGTGYAINIVTTANVYLIGNRYSGTGASSINDAGTNTTIQHRDWFEIESNLSTTALTVNQDGSGNIVEFKDGGTSVFTIADGGGTLASGTKSGVPYSLISDEGTTNLVVNPSFEVNVTDGWSSVNSATTTTSTEHYIGSLGMKVETPGSVAGEGAETATSSVATSTTYTASVFLKGSGALYLKLVGDISGITTSSAITLSSSFIRHNLSKTTASTDTFLKLQIFTASATSTTFYLDGVQLEQKSYPTTYCDGTLGPGYSWSGTAHNSTSSRTAGFRYFNPSKQFVLDTDGKLGVGSAAPVRRLEVKDTSDAQLRLTQADASQYSEFQVGATGDLTISATGGDIQMLNENLWVCESGGCGISISGTGNLVVENYAYFAGSKIMYPSELGRPKRSIILTAAGAITPTSLGASQTKVDGTNHTYYVLDFNDSTTSSAFWQWVMPDSFATATAATSVVDVTFYWETASTTGDVKWQIMTAGVKADSVEDIDPALGNSASTTDTAQGNTNDLGSVTISNYINAWEPNDYIIFKVSRLGTDAADTLTEVVRLVKIKIEYSVKQESD